MRGPDAAGVATDHRDPHRPGVPADASRRHRRRRAPLRLVGRTDRQAPRRGRWPFPTTAPIRALSLLLDELGLYFARARYEIETRVPVPTTPDRSQRGTGRESAPSAPVPTMWRLPGRAHRAHNLRSITLAMTSGLQTSRVSGSSSTPRTSRSDARTLCCMLSKRRAELNDVGFSAAILGSVDTTHRICGVHL
jgi:hypothetical protein